jgi:spermidine synthase
VPLPFRVLDQVETTVGTVTLWCRTDPVDGRDLYEVKLDDEFLMSSRFTVAEVALAELGLAAARTDAPDLDVVVGGLGLGYTAHAALRDPRVTALAVVELVPAVVSWHHRGLLPDVAGMSDDPRVRFVTASLHALALGADGILGDGPERRTDVLLVDVDHSPRHLLHPDHAPLYAPAGLAALAAHLRPGGVFALWSDDPPDDDFLADLRAAFASAEAHTVAFPNPLTGTQSANTVYVARRADAA